MASTLDIRDERRYALHGKLALRETPLQNKVRELRQALGWTQEKLAAAVGVSRQSINSIERGRYVPSLPLALTLARVFRCTTDEVFTLEKNE